MKQQAIQYVALDVHQATLVVSGCQGLLGPATLLPQSTNG